MPNETPADKQAMNDRRANLLGNVVFLAVKQALGDYQKMGVLNAEPSDIAEEAVKLVKPMLKGIWK